MRGCAAIASQHDHTAVPPLTQSPPSHPTTEQHTRCNGACTHIAESTTRYLHLPSLVLAVLVASGARAQQSEQCIDLARFFTPQLAMHCLCIVQCQKCE